MEDGAQLTIGLSGSQSLLQRAVIDAHARDDDGDATRTRVLDATRGQFCRNGIRCSSMKDVARQASVYFVAEASISTATHTPSWSSRAAVWA